MTRPFPHLDQHQADASHYGCRHCRGWDEHTDTCPVWRAIDAEARQADDGVEVAA